MRTRMDAFRWKPWAFLALPLAVYLALVIVPLVLGIVMAFSSGNPAAAGVKWAGMANFVRLVRDPAFFRALGNSCLWLVAFAVLPVLLGFLLAFFLSGDHFGVGFYKTLFFLPLALSLSVVGVLWSDLSRSGWGLLAPLFRGGADGTFVPVLAGVWREVPFAMILFLAGLKSIPGELVEAAMIAGVGRALRFRHIVLPFLAPAAALAVTVCCVDSFRAFDTVYVMAGGLPGRLDVLSTLSYAAAFRNGDWGYGAAVSTVQLVIVLALIAVYVSRTAKDGPRGEVR